MRNFRIHRSVATVAALGALIGCSNSGEENFERRTSLDDFPELAGTTPEERTLGVLSAIITGELQVPSSTPEEHAALIDSILGALVGTAHADPPYNYCTDDNYGSYVTHSLMGGNATHGSLLDPVSVISESSFCQDAYGNSLPNPSGTQFKAFTVAGTVYVDCDWGEDYNFSGGGISRRATDPGASGDTTFDSFAEWTVTGGAGAGTYNCSFETASNVASETLNDTLQSGSCTDLDGGVWTEFLALDAGQNCTVSLGDAAITPPVATCGASGDGDALDTVTFDGSASSDPFGRPLSYAWSLDTTPAGSAATLSDVSAEAPTLLMDLVGDYTATLTVSTVDGGIDSCTQTWSAVAADDFRIELWWDNADDMDLHLLRANPAGSPRTSGDCYYANCQGGGPDWGITGYANDDPVLDLDDIWGNGPENTNIAEPAGSPFEGEYVVFVHDYPWTARYLGSNGVHVNIYINGVLEKNYSFTMSGENDDYYVAKIDWPSGTITDCFGLAGC